jgi:hypothetical protein
MTGFGQGANGSAKLRSDRDFTNFRDLPAVSRSKQGADALLGQRAGDHFGGRHQRPRGGHGDHGIDLR